MNFSLRLTGAWLALLFVVAAADADDPFAAAAPAAPAVPAAQEPIAPKCFVIPSAEKLGNNAQITNYREQFSPTLYQVEWSGWPVLDFTMLAAMLLLGAVMVWRHVHFRRFWIPASLTLFYFGILRGGCICPVGSVTQMSVGLVHPELVGVFTALMFLLPLAVALCMGRVFCVAGCPLGAMQHLLGGHHSLRLPIWLERVLRGFPVLTLAATAWLGVRGVCMWVCLLDPYKTAFFFGYGWLHRAINWCQGGLVEPGFFWVGDWSAWAILIASLLAGFWIYRPFCRFVCPYGMLLGCFASVAFKRRRISQPHCANCGLCEKHCPVHAITRDPVTQEFSISSFHCIQCNRCSSYCRKNGVC
jgi:formate hydrogenlyase subunit 6/NADH:ubiquinone oxidoreductase subunit I